MSLVSSPDALLRSMWLASARGAVVVFVLAALFSFSQVGMTPHPEMRPFGYGAVGLVFGLLVLVRALGRDRSARGVRRANVATVVTFAASLAFMYFFSIYTDTSAFAALALLLFGAGASPRTTIAAAIAVSVPHLMLQSAVTYGVIPDLGFYTLQAGAYARHLNQAQSLSLYMLAVGLGIMFMRQTRRTLTALSDVFRKNAEREALVRDARLALERAIGVGLEGRLSGQQLGGFVLGIVIGQGGAAEVYEARHRETGELAAVKVFSRRDLLDRFEREAAYARMAASPHVVRVLGAGGKNEGLPFVAMERLFGSDLGEILVRRLALTPSESAEMVSQIAEGLFIAHERDVIHGDVTPRNIFRTDTGTWKLLDFGVALTRAEGAGEDRSGAGTPAYMAPEQLDEQRGPEAAVVDERTDVYALAVVAYRALTGTPAFAGRDRPALIYRVLHDQPPSPSTIARVPAALDAVLRTAMSKDPRARYRTARDFAQAFTEAAEG